MEETVTLKRKDQPIISNPEKATEALQKDAPQFAGYGESMQFKVFLSLVQGFTAAGDFGQKALTADTQEKLVKHIIGLSQVLAKRYNEQ